MFFCAECRDYLNVMLSVVMLSIIMLSVVASTVYICIKFKAYHSAALPTNIRQGESEGQ
jgi:hypothetical protein